jgi:squalene-hopene/tetraprenyl-beta-curcumene cyclase
MRTFRIVLAIVAVTIACSIPDSSIAQQKGKAKGKTWDDLVDSGLAFLKSTQAEDGTWSKANNVGITGEVLTGVLKSGKVTAQDPLAAKPLKFIESMIEEKEGHIAGPEESKVRQKNYITCVNLLALKASKEEKYTKSITNAIGYLKKIQIDESESKTPKDPWYGGVGYGPDARPDLSNTFFLLDAYKAAGVSLDDDAFKKATFFVSRMQNFKNEHNDQPWAGKINDGSFFYVQVAAKGTNTPSDDPRPGYGSMTCAGLAGLTYCGIGKDDPRVKKGLEWLANNYSVDTNPGMDEGSGGRGYYYYLMTFAKSLDAMGIDEFVDAKGKKHDWRQEITSALMNRQKANGSWSNDFPTWLEGNPDLCTGYALITLSYTKPKVK